MSARRFTQAELDAMRQSGHGDVADRAVALGLTDLPPLPKLSDHDMRAIGEMGDAGAEFVLEAQRAGMIDLTAPSLQRDLGWAREQLGSGAVDLVAEAVRDGELVDVIGNDPRSWHALLAEFAPANSWTLDEFEAAREARDVDGINAADSAGLLTWSETFRWRSSPAADQIVSDAELAALEPEQLVQLQEEGKLDWYLSLGGYDRAAIEPERRVDDGLFAEHAEQLAAGTVAPIYDQHGRLAGVRTDEAAVAEYGRLGGASSDPNLSAWRARHEAQSRPGLDRWAPPPEGSQWSDDDVHVASPEQIVAAQERGDLADYLGLAS